MFKKVLIANRGEIVGRVARTLKRMGIASVAVASEADRFNRAVLDADEHVLIGPAPAAESYLLVERILDACRSTGAEAVHPGYGFLSENVGFARALAAEGIAFIGPRPEHLEAFGLKHTARALAEASGVPLLPGSGLLGNVAAALAAAASACSFASMRPSWRRSSKSCSAWPGRVLGMRGSISNATSPKPGTSRFRSSAMAAAM